MVVTSIESKEGDTKNEIDVRTHRNRRDQEHL
jgi:hypothetical protein